MKKFISMFSFATLCLCTVSLVCAVGCSSNPLSFHRPERKSPKYNVVINATDEDDGGEVAVIPGDILVVKLRVKESLKDRYTWGWGSGGLHEALTPLPTKEVIYEFAPNHLPGDDNFQLLVFRVNKKAAAGCTQFYYGPQGSGYYWDAAKKVSFHLRERK